MHRTNPHARPRGGEPVRADHLARRRAKRRVVGTSAARRAYLDVAAALDNPPRNPRITPRQARRLVRRELIGATA